MILPRVEVLWGHFNGDEKCVGLSIAIQLSTVAVYLPSLKCRAVTICSSTRASCYRRAAPIVDLRAVRWRKGTVSSSALKEDVSSTGRWAEILRAGSITVAHRTARRSKTVRGSIPVRLPISNPATNAYRLPTRCSQASDKDDEGDVQMCVTRK